MLLQTHAWFSISSMRSAAYQQICKQLNERPKDRNEVKPSANRWFSWYRAIEKLLGFYLEIHSNFERASITERFYTARVLNNVCKDEENKLYLLFLMPILSEFQKTNLLFQKNLLTIFSAKKSQFFYFYFIKTNLR